MGKVRERRKINLVAVFAILCIMVFLPKLEVNAFAFGIGSGDYYYSIVGTEGNVTTIEITGYRGSDENLVVPEELDGKKVVGIGTVAFYDCKSQSIVLPDSVTSIGEHAFQDCSNLTSIKFSDNVTSIESGAFQGCSSLTDIQFPANLTSIESSVFNGCTSLSKIELPDTITSIGNHAFYDCDSLTSIEIPSGVTSIDGAFFSVVI